MFRSVFLLAVALLFAATPSFPATVVFDFSGGNDHGFSAADVPVNPLWTFSGTDWRVGSGISVSRTLLSPTLVANGDPIVVTFSHITNFESVWDGGILAYQVQGMPSARVTSFSSGGYNAGTIVASFPSGSGAGFTGTSTFNSVGNIAGIASGTSFVLRFEAAWDGSVQWASPNWRILSVTVSGVESSDTGVPEPATFSLLLGGCVSPLLCTQTAHQAEFKLKTYPA